MNNPPVTLFDQFLKERVFLKNVTPATVVWYQVAFKNFRAVFPDDPAPLPNKATPQRFVATSRRVLVNGAFIFPPC